MSQPRDLPQKFTDSTRKSMKVEAQGEWDQRSKRCAVHLMASLSQQVTSRRAFRQTNSPLLPLVGYYYSMFHLSVALCHIHHAIPQSSLHQLGHRPLERLLRSNFLQRNLLPESWIRLLLHLRSRREDACYPFVADSYARDTPTMLEIATGASKGIDRAWGRAVTFVHQLDDRCRDLYPLRFRIMLGIGDGFGDDTLSTYVSISERRSIMERLTKLGLST